MIYTLDAVEGHEIVKTFGMVEATTVVRVSEVTGLRKLFDAERTTHQDALNALADAAPDGANALLGVRVSTATCTDGDGDILLMLTYIGTPVELRPPPAGEVDPS